MTAKQQKIPEAETPGILLAPFRDEDYFQLRILWKSYSSGFATYCFAAS